MSSNNGKLVVYNSGLMNFGVRGINLLEEHIGGVYLDDYAFHGDAYWSLFYVAQPKEAHHHKIYGLCRDQSGSLRGRGFDDRSLAFPGVFSLEAKAFVYSRGQHDFFHWRTDSIAIDGGPAYTRVVGDMTDWRAGTFNPQTMEIKNDSAVIAEGVWSLDRWRLWGEDAR